MGTEESGPGLRQAFESAAENNQTPQQPAPESTPAQEPHSQPVPDGDTRYVEVPDVGQVPEDELIRGYLRQSDYTRKTQDLSRERDDVRLAQEFLQELEQDPVVAIRSLVNAYEIDPSQLTAQERAAVEEHQRQQQGQPAQGQGQERQESQQTNLPPEVQQELQEFRQFRQEQEQRQMRDQIKSEIGELKQKYSDFDEAGVLHAALLYKIPDLDKAYKVWAFEKQYEQGKQEGRQEGLQTATTRDEASLEGDTMPQSGEPQVSSFTDAFRLAERQANRR